MASAIVIARNDSLLETQKSAQQNRAWDNCH